MPPQPGMFPLPYSHKSRPGSSYPMNDHLNDVVMGYSHHGGPIAGPSSRIHVMPNMDDGKREKRKREISGKLGKEMSDRRDESGRHFTESISMLHATAVQLSTRPELVPLYTLRLYPLTIERSAILAQLEFEEKHSIDAVQTAYDEERERVEDEWRRGRDRVRERLMEGIEERRRRAREDKEGEGTVGDAALDAQSRPHITRKLRNKLGTSPPPTPLNGVGSNSGPPGIPLANGGPGAISHLPITTGPFLNPHSLSVDEIPSPFNLPLTSTTLPNGSGNTGTSGGGGGGGGGGGRRRPKGGGTHQNQIIGGLGKSIPMLNQNKDTEIEADLMEIRRGSKRRRVTTANGGKGNM